MCNKIIWNDEFTKNLVKKFVKTLWIIFLRFAFPVTHFNFTATNTYKKAKIETYVSKMFNKLIWESLSRCYFFLVISGCQIKYCVLEDEVSISGSLGRGLISTGSETASEPRLEVSLNGGAGGFSSSSDDIFFSFWISKPFFSDIFSKYLFYFPMFSWGSQWGQW